MNDHDFLNFTLLPCAYMQKGLGIKVAISGLE